MPVEHPSLSEENFVSHSLSLKQRRVDLYRTEEPEMRQHCGQNQRASGAICRCRPEAIQIVPTGAGGDCATFQSLLPL